MAFLILFPFQIFGGEIKIQVASTHSPTEQFLAFAAEFLLAFGEHCEANQLSAQFNEKEKNFYLIERRDQEKWQVGLCEPLDNENNLLGFSSGNISFRPIWIIKWETIKNAKQQKAKAREAAKFLFDYIQRKEI